MNENTNSDLDDKIRMAKSFLDSAKLLERTTNAVIADSQEEAKAKVDDTRYDRKMTAHFLYSIVFELCIKIIWEIEHGKPPKLNHDIFSLYEELSLKSKQDISKMYDTQLTNINHIISLSKGKLSVILPVQTLQDALKVNAEIMRDFKYDGKLTGKSSALGSIVWTSDRIYTLPKPELIVFMDLLLDYTISLKQVNNST